MLNAVHFGRCFDVFFGCISVSAVIFSVAVFINLLAYAMHSFTAAKNRFLLANGLSAYDKSK
jgi:hypothetical protein